MYEWLVEDMRKVKTRKFFLVESSPTPVGRRISVDYKLPPSYKSFLERFGKAKLFRQGNLYLLEVWAVPLEVQSVEDGVLWQFGRTDMSALYFKDCLLVENQESPVFEERHGQRLKNVAASFDEWLKAACTNARSLFKKSAWKAIEQGPAPFSEHEKAIVQARKQFHWKMIGLTPSGDLRFEIHNGSNLVLPYLSVKVRGEMRPPKQGILEGGVWLPISSIKPGETQVVEKDCYKELVDPKNIQVSEAPEPEPEDRERYWEFNGMSEV
jgi:hypothetical protein